ncbi:SMI1/KNR4 family protein [Nannocystis sp. ILAH1]|uniref:SMI1/KNR4 family protein n=1 Tax=Nannocystis sp. ILAH1 TaxID=2996789 RepID=UPI002271534F|nr:SMI1/KNR4 family protein [Nannocystis sp. ILAH1]MCY0989623.1 SMI1/KNR4 family protein [Nannocystis sp. ILAH1]
MARKRAPAHSFRARFDAMVAALRKHPKIEVYEVVVRPPASAADLAAAEAAIGMPLPPEIRAFYEAHDGVFLEWGLKGEEYERTAAFDGPDDNHPPGCINLLPVRRAMSPSWEEDSHVNEIQPDHQELLFGAPLDPQPEVRAVCVDNYARYHHGDLVLGPTPVMVVSTDYGADMDSSDFVSFPVYLDLTLALFGVDRYEHGVGIGWSRKPKRVEAWTKQFELGALLAKLDDDGYSDDEDDEESEEQDDE